MRSLWLTPLVLTLALGCASPPWEGMSQTEIESWKGLDYNSEQAQELVDHGIDPAAAAEWKQGGIVGWEAIEAWQKNGMSPAVAGAWQGAGFNSKDARKWAAEKFEPSEAEGWLRAGKSLSAAVDGRADGLMPIPAVSSPSETISEPSSEAPSSDVPSETSSDVPSEAGSDVPSEAGSDAQSEAGSDAQSEAGSDAPGETTSGAQSEASAQ